MREIYVRTGDRTEIAVVEDGRLVEYVPQDASSSTEAIYLGRVDRVVPGMKAAFVRIGQEKNGFLPLEERNARDLPALLQGQDVLVQVRKEAQGVKGAFLSRDICFAGEFVLLSPLNRLIAVSSRISRESDRRALREMGREIAADRFGLVLRTAALDADPELVRAEAESLWQQWQNVRAAVPTAHVPSALHRPRTVLDSLLDDYRPRGIDAIVTNDEGLAARLQGMAPVRVAGENMFAAARISNQLQQAQERGVWLESGGNLVFDPCEAMTVVDVNTARFTGSRDLQETVLQLNLEACAEIARQVRLRNISGIIIIDMIDMRSQEQRQAVLDELKRVFADDRVKTVVHGFTSLGLVEMTRRRSRPPLREMLKMETHQEE